MYGTTMDRSFPCGEQSLAAISNGEKEIVVMVCGSTAFFLAKLLWCCACIMGHGRRWPERPGGQGRKCEG